MTHVFFIDRSIGKHLVATKLRAAGARVEVHDNHFPQDAHDEVWLAEVGRRGWAVLTQDDRIRYREAEISAARSAGVALFIFVGKKLRGPTVAEAIASALPAMKALLDSQRRPFVAKVTRTGSVSVVG